MSELRDQLSDLVQSPGWKWFIAKTESEWGAGGKRFESTVDKFADSRDEDRVVLDQIRQIAVCRREILRLLKSPEEEIARLKSLEPQPASLSRRGAL